MGVAEGDILWAKGGFVGLVVRSLRPGLDAVLAGKALRLVNSRTCVLWEGLQTLPSGIFGDNKALVMET